MTIRYKRSMTLAAWARSFGLTPPRLQQRLAYGWTMERALRTPCRKAVA